MITQDHRYHVVGLFPTEGHIEVVQLRTDYIVGALRTCRAMSQDVSEGESFYVEDTHSGMMYTVNTHPIVRIFSHCEQAVPGTYIGAEVSK